VFGFGCRGGDLAGVCFVGVYVFLDGFDGCGYCFVGEV